jgi:RNA polymerase sigma-70 factor (ECF subfamily)
MSQRLPQPVTDNFGIAPVDKRHVEDLIRVARENIPADVPAPDSELISRIRAGDERAFGMLYDRHSRLVFSIALRILQDPLNAEDVMQDVFMQIWRSPPQFKEAVYSLTGWIAVVSRNRCLSFLRVRANQPSSAIQDFDFASLEDLEHDTERHELHAMVIEILSGLPLEQQRMIRMCFAQEMTHSQIAAETGLPLGTIKSRVRAALATLRKGLNSGGIEDCRGTSHSSNQSSGFKRLSAH